MEVVLPLEMPATGTVSIVQSLTTMGSVIVIEYSITALTVAFT